MNPKPPSAESRPFLPKDQQRFALWLLSAAILLALVVLNQRGPAFDLTKSVAAIEQRLTTRHRTNALRRVRTACRQADCNCVAMAAGAGLDVDAGREVLELFDRSKTCTGERFEGMRIEALMRSGASQPAADGAAALMTSAPRQPHALCALALSSYRGGALPQAMTFARSSIQAQRGSGASELLGLAAYAAGDLAAAREGFSAVLEEEPDDVDALYNLGLVAQKQNRYGEARSNYLRALKLSPKHKNARYNLGVLAHSAGAEAEARHHLAKLRTIAPGDPMIPALEAALAQPPKNPPTHVLKLGTPGPPPTTTR
jgi:tetratricopeptide (TPR) repeat protein